MVILVYSSFWKWKRNEMPSFMNEQQLIVQWRSNFYYLFVCVWVKFSRFFRPFHLHFRNIYDDHALVRASQEFGDSKKPYQQKIRIKKDVTRNSNIPRESSILFANWPQNRQWRIHFAIFRLMLLLLVSDSAWIGVCASFHFKVHWHYI